MTALRFLLVTLLAGLSASALGHAQSTDEEQQLRDIQQGLNAAPDPRLKVLIAEQAPAELVDVYVVRNLNGTPAAVQVTVRNRSTSVLNSAHVACYVFDARPGLRLAAFGVVNRPDPRPAGAPWRSSSIAWTPNRTGRSLLVSKMRWSPVNGGRTGI